VVAECTPTLESRVDFDHRIPSPSLVGITRKTEVAARRAAENDAR
jgi:hypothetical protein